MLFRRIMLAGLLVGATAGLAGAITIASKAIVEEARKRQEMKIMKENMNMYIKINDEIKHTQQEIEDLQNKIWYETNCERVKKGLKPILKLV